MRLLPFFYIKARLETSDGKAGKRLLRSVFSEV
jgi:hypothetical protein